MPPDQDEDQIVAQIEAEISARHTVLNGLEIPWRDRQVFLESRGYMLRPRYRPGWVPSWQGNPEVHYEDCEDFEFLPVSQE